MALTPVEQATLDFWLIPVRIFASVIKTEWERQRNNSLEELGLPPLKRDRQ